MEKISISHSKEIIMEALSIFQGFYDKTCYEIDRVKLRR